MIENFIVSNDIVNAFCMPGDRIILHSGILSIAKNEQSLAFILAHEMVHTLLNHVRTRISAHNIKNTATTVARLDGFDLSL